MFGLAAEVARPGIGQFSKAAQDVLTKNNLPRINMPDAAEYGLENIFYKLMMSGDMASAVLNAQNQQAEREARAREAAAAAASTAQSETQNGAQFGSPLGSQGPLSRQDQAAGSDRASEDPMTLTTDSVFSPQPMEADTAKRGREETDSPIEETVQEEKKSRHSTSTLPPSGKD